VSPDAGTAKLHKSGTAHRKLYSEALRGKVKHTHHKFTVASKESESADTIKELLKSNMNPTEIKVGINSLKTPRNGKVQIKARNKEDIDKLTRDINEKCGDKLTAC
jgi:translation initiation factor 2 alpha subunit (eIF-2alpha)